MGKGRVLLITVVTISLAAWTAFAGGQGASDKVKVVAWSMFNQGEPLQQVLDNATQRFMKENPSIVVENVWQGRAVLTPLRGALAAGEQVDIVDQNHPSVLSSVVYEDLALPIDTYLDSKAYDSDKTWRETFLPGVFELETEGKGGPVHFVPRDNYTKGFWYDKRMFDDLGIQPQVVGMKWSEFRQMLDKVRGALPNVSPLGIRGAQNSFTIWWFAHAAIREAGLDAWNAAARDKSGQMWQSNPDFRKGLDRLYALQEGGYFQKGFEGYVRMQAQVEWVNAEVALLFVGAWLPTEMSQQAPEGFTPRMFAWPDIEGGKGNNLTEHFANGYAILKDSKVPDAAALYLKSILSTKTGQEIADSQTPVPLLAVKQPPTHVNQFTMVKQMKGMPQLGGVLRHMSDYVTTVLHKSDGQFWGRQIGPQGYIDNLVKDTKAYWAKKQ